MKMLSFPSSLTIAPIKFKRTKDDVQPVLIISKYNQIWSIIFATILISIYFKVKVYDSLQMGKDFFLYIRSLSTFIEIVCILGNILCYNFGARKTLRVYKKMKKMVQKSFSEMDYKKMYKLFLMELLVPSLFLSTQFIVYCYQFYNSSGLAIILVFVLDSNITVLLTATCLRCYNITIVFKICLDKLLMSFEKTIDSRQLQIIWASYLEMYALVKSTNEFFGIGLICSLAVSYIYCLIALFGIFTFVNVLPSIAFINLLWFCMEITRVLPVIIGTCICEVNARKLHARLGCYDGEERHLEEVSMGFL